jgi:hypothetical protein
LFSTIWIESGTLRMLTLNYPRSASGRHLERSPTGVDVTNVAFGSRLSGHARASTRHRHWLVDGFTRVLDERSPGDLPTGLIA